MKAYLFFAAAALSYGCVSEPGDSVVGDGHISLTDYMDYETYPENIVVDEPEVTFNSLASIVPEFSGFYYDENGDFVIRLTDLGRSEEAIALIQPLAVVQDGRGVASADEDSVDENGGGDSDGVSLPPTLRTEQAEFSWNDLYAWRMPIRRPIMNIDGVVTLAIDVVTNRLRITHDRLAA